MKVLMVKVFIAGATGAIASPGIVVQGCFAHTETTTSKRCSMSGTGHR